MSLPTALHVGLEEKDKKLLDLVLTEDEQILNRAVNILKESAELVGRKSDITLMKHQTIPILMMQVSKRVFNGFSPGIGKTYSSCGAYALYRTKCINKGIKPKKLLLVTEGTHVKGMESDFNRGGVKLYPLFGGSHKIDVQLRKANNESKGLNLEEDYDGIVTSWSSLKTNAFLEYYMEHVSEYKFGIFDETACLMGTKALLYDVTNSIVNKYDNGMEYVMFLNGTAFGKNIYDIYNQFKILRPRLIPNKRWIDDNYVIKENREIWGTQLFNNNGSANKRTVVRKVGDIVDYKNQEEFRHKMRYYYIHKNKSDIKGELPTHNYKLHMMPLTPKLKKEIETGGAMSIHSINSPGTSNSKAKMTRTAYPKLDYLINRFKETESDRPIIYCLNKSSMGEIKGYLEKEGYSVGILNGEVKTLDKDKVIKDFNKGRLDTIILNTEKAINLPTSDRIIFYNIPSSPLSTNQIKARIDRNNYTDPKFYDFLCYEDSPEVGYIARLGFFREKHGTLLTGQGEDNVYHELIEQLKEYYDREVVEEVGNVLDKVDGVKVSWESVEKEVYDLLGVKV